MANNHPLMGNFSLNVPISIQNSVELSNSITMEPKRHTTDPYVTGSSVLAMTYKDGIMMASDTLGSYGSLARFRQLRRIRKIGDTNTVIGGTGEYADFQALIKELEELTNRDYARDEGQKKTPKEIWNYLTRRLYGQRNRFDPFWNQLIIAGIQPNNKKSDSNNNNNNNKEFSPFLGYVDLQGTSFEDVTLATGYGSHLARPMLRNKQHLDENGRSTINEQETRAILEDCLRVLWYRDARTINRVQICKITTAGVEISEPFKLHEDWSVGYKEGEILS